MLTIYSYFNYRSDAFVYGASRRYLIYKERQLILCRLQEIQLQGGQISGKDNIGCGSKVESRVGVICTLVLLDEVKASKVAG